ncbi:MAG TPA: acyltransferase [Candidatus Sulfotelmatobacter sp.]|jgi:peptidoglycan/LPS O-acetylase OafA/YrhL|nr:acyltransferase [Candidatus Sulfotelmatobacter sp.]
MASEVFTIRSGTWKRLDGIDLLRGLAIVFVLMNHVNIRLLGAKVLYAKFLPAQLVHVLVWNGQLGVQMFFAVSGFLITSITIRRWGALSNVRLRDFYMFRFARIAPLLLLLLVILSGLHFAHVNNFIVTAKTGGLGRALLAALTFHINVLEARHGYLPANWDVLWSLSVEEMFYLFFPLVCRVFGRGKLFFVILLTFIVLGPFGRTVFAHGNEVWQEYSYLGGMEGIALGCLTALIVSRTSFSRPVLWALGTGGATVVLFSLVFSWQAYRGWPGRTGLNMTILGIGTCMFIAATAQTQWRSPRVLTPLLRIGQYSYEVYLTHMFVVFGLFGLFLDIGRPMRLVPALFILTILTAGVLGALIASFYSEPMNRFLRNYSKSLHVKPATAMDSESVMPTANG